MNSSRLNRVLAWLAVCVMVGWQSVSADLILDGNCPILDRVDEPVWELGLGYIEQATVDESPSKDDFGTTRFRAEVGMFYLRTDFGHFDIRAGFDFLTFTGDGGIALPDQVGVVNLDVAWIHRLEDGLGLKLIARPGYYSDFEDFSNESFFIPFGVLGIKNFSPELSGQLGLMIYPTFEHAVDPRVGFRWLVSDTVLLDLFYPESRLYYTIDRQWEVFVGLSNLVYPEYQLEENDPRDRFMIDEKKIFVGAHMSMSDQVRMTFELGQVFDRELDFGRAQSSSEVDNGFYIGVSIGGIL